MERAEHALYEELRHRGIPEPVVRAMASVPRTLFVPEGLRSRA
jgi:protein-L-isoaspartate O-methyltransferase